MRSAAPALFTFRYFLQIAPEVDVLVLAQLRGLLRPAFGGLPGLDRPRSASVLRGVEVGGTGGVQLRVPDTLSPPPLPPYSPQLNPVEIVWQFIRQNHLSKRSPRPMSPSWTPAAAPGTT